VLRSYGRVQRQGPLWLTIAEPAKQSRSQPSPVERERQTQCRPIVTLKTRAEFQRVRGGGRASTAAFVLEGKARLLSEPPPGIGQYPADHAPVTAPTANATPGPRFGFTITKKIGNAVVRNRIRRRLRSALTQIADLAARPGNDYVVIARKPAAVQPFASLLADLKVAFERVHATATPQSPRVPKQPARRSPDSKPDRQGVTEGSSPITARSATSTHHSKSSRD